MSRSQHPALQQPRWQERAACRSHPTWWWFAIDAPEAVEAYLICADCAVRAECLAFALDRADLLGIWAATTSAERWQLRRQRRNATIDTREQT